MKINTTTTGIYVDGQRINCKEDLNWLTNHLQQRFEWHRTNKPNKFDKE